jgi:hypothetical protein
LTILRCLQAQVGIHALDAADAAAATVGANGLTFGARTYKTVLVPAAGIMAGPAFRRLQEAAAGGTHVVWFGGGPTKLAEESGPLVQAPAPAGEIRLEREPSRAWCRGNLPAQAAVGGPQAKECYVRRFQAEDGAERLFAVNISKAARVFTLSDENGAAWNPDPDLADGCAVRTSAGTRWSVPGYGCGLFTRGPAPAGYPRLIATHPAGGGATFERVGPNGLRLDRCRIILKGRPPQEQPYPQPFWQRFKDYTASETFQTFAGDMPVESTVAQSDLRYQFTFTSRAALKKTELVLDPRCARGQFELFFNARKISTPLMFPLSGTKPLRVPVAGVRKGRNVLEFRFQARSAMEGLLCPVWLEGAFQVWLRKGQPVVGADAPVAVSTKGWLEMGLAHFMGDGVYRWTETFSEKSLAEGPWALELEEVMDSAKLVVNGQDRGTRAWGPWRWNLPGLRPGENVFELTVSSTAGNRLQLLYPAQPQGWMGKARLVRRA